MESSSNGHCCGLVPTGRHQGFYALVSYVPGPLGEYLKLLRGKLVPGCRLRSHVTLLPPRDLRTPEQKLIDELNKRMATLPPFEVTLGNVEVFETTGVIYIAIERGWRQLEEYHSILSEGVLWFEEYYPFHPHMTLGQEIPGSQFENALEAATRTWQQCPYSQTFTVEQLTFVRNVNPNRWDALTEYTLGSPAVSANLQATE